MTWTFFGSFVGVLLQDSLNREFRPFHCLLSMKCIFWEVWRDCGWPKCFKFVELFIFSDVWGK